MSHLHQCPEGFRVRIPLPHDGAASRILLEILAYGFWIRKRATLRPQLSGMCVELLKELARQGDLRDPESVKVVLTRVGWAKGNKEIVCGAYAICAKHHGFTFVPLGYRRVEKLSFLPLDSEGIVLTDMHVVLWCADIMFGTDAPDLD